MNITKPRDVDTWPAPPHAVHGFRFVPALAPEPWQSSQAAGGAQHDLALATLDRVFQREPLLHAEILTARRTATASRAAGTSEAAEELGEEILEVGEAVRPAEIRHALEAGMSELIVAGAFPLVRQHLVGLGRFLEAKGRVVVSRGGPGSGWLFRAAWRYALRTSSQLTPLETPRTS